MKKTQIALKDDVIFAFNNKKIHNLCKIVKILFSFTHKFPSFLEGALWWRRATRIGHPNGQSCWNALGECTSFSESTFIVIQIPRYYNWRWDIIGNYVFRSFFLLSFTAIVLEFRGCNHFWGRKVVLWLFFPQYHGPTTTGSLFRKRGSTGNLWGWWWLYRR